MFAIEWERQADAFLAYHTRRGGLWLETWATWVLSKDFTSADAEQIWRLVHDELVARGELTYVDIAA